VHFASRSALDIEGLGEQRVAQLLMAGLVADVADLFTLRVADVEALEGFAEISATALVREIGRAKTAPLSRVLVGLGIRHVGPVAARVLAKRFLTYAALASAPLEELEAVEGIGPIIAQAIYLYCREEENRERIARFVAVGFTLEEAGERPSTLEATLTGKAVVVTGTVPGFTREEAEAAIVARGGTSPGSVSKKTYCVVVGESPGAAKVTKAEDLGIPMVDASGFTALLETGEIPSAGA
jgi:DNA ligase (NAD+)